MKTYTNNKFAICSMLLSILFVISSCRDHNFDFEDHYYETVTQQYEKQFKDQYGEIDPQHDWSTAMAVKGTLASSDLQDAETIFVYSAMPTTRGALLLYRGKINRQEFWFDAPKGVNDAYVVMKNAAGETVLADYITVNNGVMYIAATTRSAATRADGCPVTLGTRRTSDQLGCLKDPENHFPGLHYTETDDRVDFYDIAPYYHLNGVEKTTGQSWKVSDLYEIIGKGGVFADKGNNAVGSCNLETYFNILEAAQGVEYVLSSDGPVDLDFIYGVTANRDYLGYFYFNDSDAGNLSAISARPRYVLCDASPDRNITVQGITMTNPNDMYVSVVQHYEEDMDWIEKKNVDPVAYNWVNVDEMKTRNNKLVTPAHYKLAYFGENGTSDASYTFPQGTHVVFFIVTQGLTRTNDWGNYVEYSVPSYNKWEYKPWVGTSQKYNTYDPFATGAIGAVSYKWGDQIIVGFEDDYLNDDGDMNDILMVINGNFSNTRSLPQMCDYYFESTDTPLNECIIAYEDMGAVGDFDFNDVVLGISKDAETNTATVSLKAAGGTLETYITYDFEGNGVYTPLAFYDSNAQLSTADLSEEEATEVHAAFHVSQSTMVNTGTHSVSTTPRDKISVDNEWTVTSQAHRFAIRVKGGPDGEYKDIHIPSRDISIELAQSPQAILVSDGNWEWPAERQPISDKYPEFLNWVNDHLQNHWYDKSWDGTSGGSNNNNTSSLKTTTLNVTFDQSTFKVGDNNRELILSKNSDGAVSVSSGNTGVVSIVSENGKYYLHAVGAGSAEVTISVAQTSTYTSLSKKVTVYVTAAGETTEEENPGGNEVNNSDDASLLANIESATSVGALSSDASFTVSKNGCCVYVIVEGVYEQYNNTNVQIACRYGSRPEGEVNTTALNGKTVIIYDFAIVQIEQSDPKLTFYNYNNLKVVDVKVLNK